MNQLNRTMLTILVVTFMFATSCQDETLTPGELTAKKIKEVAKQSGLDKASVYLNNQNFAINAPFRIEGTFLVTFTPNPTYHDLTKLVRFTPITSAERIDFYFE